MKPSAIIYFNADTKPTEKLESALAELANRGGFVVRTKIVPSRQLRQLDLAEASVSLGISVLGSLAAPALIQFISDIKKHLKKIKGAIYISAESAETIGREVVARYVAGTGKPRLLSVSTAVDGKRFTLTYRHGNRTFTVVLNQHGELESCKKH